MPRGVVDDPRYRQEDIFINDDHFYEDAPGADFDPTYFHGFPMDDLNQMNAK